MGKVDTAYQDIRTHKRNLIIMQIKTTPITMLIGLTKTTMRTNAIRTTMSIGIAGKKMMSDKRDNYVWKV